MFNFLYLHLHSLAVKNGFLLRVLYRYAKKKRTTSFETRERNEYVFIYDFPSPFSDTDSIFALVIDLHPDPLGDRCFFKLMREIAEELDTGNVSCDREEGDPMFRTSDDQLYEKLVKLRSEQTSRLGKVKIETPGKKHSPFFF